MNRKGPKAELDPITMFKIKVINAQLRQQEYPVKCICLYRWLVGRQVGWPNGWLGDRSVVSLAA